MRLRVIKDVRYFPFLLNTMTVWRVIGYYRGKKVHATSTYRGMALWLVMRGLFEAHGLNSWGEPYPT